MSSKEKIFNKILIKIPMLCILRPLSILMKIVCIQAILVGAFGGVLSFVSSVQYIVESDYVPCYIEEMPSEC